MDFFVNEPGNTVEGVRYIEMHHGDAYVLGPPPSRGGDLELEGGVNMSLWKYGVRSTWNT